MIQPIKIHQTVRHTLAADTSEPKTVFTISPIDGPLLASILDEQTSYSIARDEGPDAEAGIQIAENRKYIKLVTFGLKAVENFGDFKLEMEKYHVEGVDERVGVSIECMKQISLGVVRELGKKIHAISELSKEQEKNSNSHSTTS